MPIAEKRTEWILKNIEVSQRTIKIMEKELRDLNHKILLMELYIKYADKDEPGFKCNGCDALWNDYIPCCPDKKKVIRSEN